MSKKIKNVTESFNFRMSQLTSKQMGEKEAGTISDYNLLRSRMPFKSSVTEEEVTADLYSDEEKYKEKLEEYKNRMVESMPEWLTKECQRFGVKYPSDTVALKMRLGNVMFDFYRQAVQQPQAPLAKALFDRKVMDYADALDKDVFEIPEDVSKAVEKVLTDDELWNSCVASAWTEVEKEDSDEPTKVYMTLKSQGVFQYKKILAGLLEAYMPQKVGNKAKTNSKKVKKIKEA